MLTGGQIVQGDEVEEFWALKDINFEIQPGDRVGIIGRHGAGKSPGSIPPSRTTNPAPIGSQAVWGSGGFVILRWEE